MNDDKTKSTKLYVFKNAEGKYYAGHSGCFDKKIKNARFFVSEKMALRHIYTDNYEELHLCEVEITELREKLVQPQDYIANGNSDCEVWVKKQKGVI